MMRRLGLPLGIVRGIDLVADLVGEQRLPSVSQAASVSGLDVRGHERCAPFDWRSALMKPIVVNHD